MKKKNLLVVMLMIVLILIIGCVEKSPLTKEELKDLPSDDPVLIMSEAKALTGQGYAQLTSQQKQAFWNCWKSECQSLLKEAQQTKDYSAYRQCSLGCFDNAQTSTENVWCEDSDSVDYLTKGTVTSNIYTNGKEDYCYTFSSGKTYLMEGKCVNNKYQYQQKNCVELGNNYVCEEGICIEEIPTFDSILTEEIPQEWINKFNNDFNIKFSAYVPIIEYPDGTWKWDEANKVVFNAEEKVILKEAFIKAVYSMSRVDSYFTKSLPWTTGQSYYDWLKNSAGTITFLADPNSFDSAYGVGINFNGKNMISNIEKGMLNTWQNQDLNSPNIGQGIINLISIITHEARHNNGIYHTTCKNSNNMDENLKSMGAHGVNVMLRHWMEYLLPEELVQSAYDDNVDWMFGYSSFLDRMCSLDPIAKTIEQEDLDWVNEVSDHPLDFDPETMWTIEFQN
jgi:hypothetical protein